MVVALSFIVGFFKLLYRFCMTHIPHDLPLQKSEVKNSDAKVQYYFNTWWLPSFKLFTVYMEYHCSFPPISLVLFKYILLKAVLLKVITVIWSLIMIHNSFFSGKLS